MPPQLETLVRFVRLGGTLAAAIGWATRPPGPLRLRSIGRRPTGRNRMSTGGIVEMKFIFGLLTGLVLGAVGAVLYSVQSGRDLREAFEQVRQELDSRDIDALGTRLEARFTQMQALLEERISQVRDKTSTTVEQAADAAEAAVDEASAAVETPGDDAEPES